MRSRDAEVREVVTQLDALLDELRASVSALTAILAGPPDGGTVTTGTGAAGDR